MERRLLDALFLTPEIWQFQSRQKQSNGGCPWGMSTVHSPEHLYKYRCFRVSYTDISAWGSGVARFDGRAMPEPQEWDE
ncbi:MAG: hypothetical protein Q4F47_02920 [Bacteroidaceae bacterium]|nr:hypothetical protein [Bacteroidaceae bacterium]MDO5481987.1 hypothetical protein [Bacteroidaceae bacterium]